MTEKPTHLVPVRFPLIPGLDIRTVAVNRVLLEQFTDAVKARTGTRRKRRRRWRN